MAVFGRNRHSRADPRTLSAIVKEEDECWRVTWLGDSKNKLPAFEAACLAEVTDLATAGAQAIYRTGDQPPGAILTFVIYPRGYGTSALMYEISGNPGRLQAHSVEDRTNQVQAADLDQLVTAVRRQVHADYAMLSWVRRLEDLPAGPLPRSGWQ